ncbi:MAG: response regulator [Bacteroidales bacterium]|nr:response regulator [Bacteroidales bacterium]
MSLISFTSNKERILIADDDNSILAYTEMVVKSMGYNVNVVNNGLEAINFVLVNKPDLIILDWKMPVMDGLEATKILKNNPETKDIPIIMITGIYEDGEQMIVALDNGVNDYIRKPFFKTELIARIRSQLKQFTYFKEVINLKTLQVNQMAVELAHTIEHQRNIYSKLEDLIENPAVVDKKILIEIADLIKSYNLLKPIDSFNEKLNDLNIDFVSRLYLRHPNLTPAEIKLCTLLRLNLSTKEIASLLFQTYDSVRVSRKRLRDKLQIPENENLVNYFIGINSL